ncbi:Hypothetical predicted protein [Paramuricea clavata]|uniref:Reverse transcriptase domain-containing protein n=1 Tax=Paramuricea clavata TaxID=317549 RepID=A0A7D9I2X0_PARCT|nr:Hypothetical predicted protein [Paramuricea clavata]
MNGERQWLVLVGLALLTFIFTAINGHPFREQDTGFGIKDDPAENQPLSLAERDTTGKAGDASIEPISDISGTANSAGNASTTASAIPTTNSTSLGPNNTTKSPEPFNNSTFNQNVTTDAQNKTKNLTTTASRQNVAIIATTAVQTGNTLILTSIRSRSVNMKINPSQTIKIVPKNSSGIGLATYTRSLKLSLTQTPSEGSLKLSAIRSASASLNPSKSATIMVKPTVAVSSAAPSSNPPSTQKLSGAPSTRHPSGTPSTQVPSGKLSNSPTIQSSSVAPSTESSFVVLSTKAPNPGTQSTQHSSDAPSTEGATEVPSTSGTKVPSTQTTQKVTVTGASTKLSSPTSQKLPSTSKPSTVLSTGPVSSLPPTTVKAPESTSNHASSEKPSTKVSTQQSTRKPTTQGIEKTEKPSTKVISVAPTTKEATTTVPKEPTTNVKSKTTKAATTKAATTKAATTKAATKKATMKKEATKKPIAVKTKARNQNDEGRMPPPDQGKEAVLWDFIVPVAIGTGVALAIAFGVVLVRACRRRKLIKVRFGGKLAGFEGDNLNNNLISDGTPDTVEILQNIFTKPWSKLPETIIPSLEDVASSLRQENPPTPSIGQVKTALKQLNSKKATGSDGIPAWVLKRYCEELAPIVHDIICASIKECEYPTAYKHALVIPVPKVNPPRDIENDFRQISILPQMAKVLEKLQLKLNLPSSRINDNQHAFTSKRSTVSALTNISQNWFNVTDNTHSAKNGVHALFIDFRKAFDLVDHGILLRKLAEMNVTKAFWLWKRSFLEDRRQQVKLAGTLSSVKPCPAGVPQGSIRPVLEYAAPIWGGLPQYLIDEIESIQNRCIKILGTSRCNFETLEQRRAHLTVKEYQRILSDPTNPCNKLIPQLFTHEHDLRTTNNLPYVVSYTKRHRQSFIPRAISLLKQS